MTIFLWIIGSIGLWTGLGYCLNTAIEDRNRKPINVKTWAGRVRLFICGPLLWLLFLAFWSAEEDDQREKTTWRRPY